MLSDGFSSNWLASVIFSDGKKDSVTRLRMDTMDFNC
jgi:hypothetical protein